MHTTKTIKLIAAAAPAFGANPKRLHLLSRLLSSRKKTSSRKIPVRLTISSSPRASPWPPPRGRIPGSPAPASSPASSPWSATAFGGRSGLKHESSSVCPPDSACCYAADVLQFNWNRRQVSDRKALHFALANIGSDTEKCGATSKAAFLRST